uniref:CSON004544 protein n=1 Tax=Culicoides sonorensis TaxID=179676 RepID=A0A336LTY7_CULSO
MNRFHFNFILIYAMIYLTNSNIDGFRLKRFVGGRAALAGEYKYQVQLRLFDENNPETSSYYNCTGALISRELVLTSVGCVYDKIEKKIRDPSKYLIVTGTILNENSFEDEHTRRVKAIEVHPNQTRIYPYPHDIALLLLDEPFNEANNEIEPIQMISKHEFDEVIRKYETCHSSGWGHTKYYETGAFSDTLQSVNIQIMNQDQCNLYGPPEGTICAGAADVSACRGDGGAPLVCGGKLTGIAFYGFNYYYTDMCIEGHITDFYVDLIYHRDWIDQTISKLFFGDFSNDNINIRLFI